MIQFGGELSFQGPVSTIFMLSLCLLQFPFHIGSALLGNPGYIVKDVMESVFLLFDTTMQGNSSPLPDTENILVSVRDPPRVREGGAWGVLTLPDSHEEGRE